MRLLARKSSCLQSIHTTQSGTGARRANLIPLTARVHRESRADEKIPNILPKEFPLTYDITAQDSQIAVINALVKQSLPIVPKAESVTRVNIPSILPQNGTIDTDIIVLGDIFLETLGISFGDESLIISFIESDERIESFLKEILEKVSTKNWKDVVKIGENLFDIAVKLIIGGNFLKKFSDTAIRKLTFGLALRCVPILGWLYLAFSFVVSIKKNYSRFSFA